MARKVFISSDMSIDERLMSLDTKAALIWPWMLMALDDWGRGDASPRRLKAQVFPMLDTVTVADIADALASYASAGLLVLYQSDGKSYMAVPSVKWFRYQTHISTDKRSSSKLSRFPSPPEEPVSDQNAPSCAVAAETREIARDCAEKSSSPHHTTPPPSPSLSPPPHHTTPPRAGGAAPVSASPGLVGGGLCDKSRGKLVAEGCTNAEIECAYAEICLHPPTQRVRNVVSLLRTVITRQRDEASITPNANPPPVSEEAKAAAARAEAKRQSMVADVGKYLSPADKAAVDAIAAAAAARKGAAKNGEA